VLAEVRKPCSVCGQRKPLELFHKQAAGRFGREARCKACRAAAQVAYMANEQTRQRINAHKFGMERKRMAENPERYQGYVRARKARDKQPENLIKYRARRRVITAVNSGKLVRLPCERCGAPPPTHGHHTDYSKPLDVIWLCRPCHAREHRKVRNG
jgi:hypothetical protein